MQTEHDAGIKANAHRYKPLTKRTGVTVLLVITIIPLTIYLGLLGDRRYYFVSLLIILYAMVPFFMIFEKRKPQARELVVIAVMCALAAASRSVFIFVPFFKPLVAIVIITGIAFGGEAGFLCGAASAFISNFVFGQGPWTPWQMFAYGIAGFLAGIFCQKGWLKGTRLPLCLFGGVVVMLVVGPLLDFCALFTMTSVVNRENAVALLISGLPVNGIHAAATVLFLLLLSKPMLEKLNRIKLKYGMLRDE